ncbi:MAG TPA: hypothetical protein DEP42_02685, partial [Ruminococcaceae bacterium]|nr:hypothetical protein [Oscillospiraceae bacterium]
EVYPSRFWVYVGITIGGMIVLAAFLRYHPKNSSAFLYRVTTVLTRSISLYVNYFIVTGKQNGENGTWYKTTAVEGAKKLTLSRTPFSRIDVYNGMDNLGMFWKWPTIQAFQSVVPISIMNFYSSMGIQRDVASRPDLQYIGLRSLLSVKYLVQQNATDTIDSTGWVFDSYQNGMKVWRNTNFIPMGFTFSSYITQEEYEASPSKDLLLVKGLLLNDTQIKKYGNILSPLPTSDVYNTGTTQLATDSAARTVSACSTFKTDKQGFSATIKLSRPNLVFFSVPYDSGWSATVNGKAAKIENVDVGFMAVKCENGNSTIHFTYKTPGLSVGTAVTAASAGIFIVYVLCSFAYSRKRPIRGNQIIPNKQKQIGGTK